MESGRALDRAGLERLLARPAVRAVLAALEVPGAETRLVGGCVRDALLGTRAADVDLATTLLPDAVIGCAEKAGLKAVPTGIAHGTVTLVVASEPVEVTTLREDVETDGRHALVRFGGDFVRDAERRDFTVNALSLGADAQLHDTTGGVADLERGRLRFIGDPASRIREDSLRILRFFRFHARFGRGAPDPAGLAACVSARDSLGRLSRERVRAEFLKLLAAPGALPMVATLSETGLLARITGGVGEMGRLSRVLAAGEGVPMRLAALAVASREDAARLQERLRLSKAECSALSAYADALAAARSRTEVGAHGLRALAAEHGLAAVSGVLAALAGEPRPRITAEAQDALAALRNAGTVPILPLTGADLVAGGVPAGPRVGRGLTAARRLWLDTGCPTDPDSVAALRAHAIRVAGT